MVSNLVKQHKQGIQSSDRLHTDNENVNINNEEGHQNQGKRLKSANQHINLSKVDWEKEYGIVIKKRADDERESIFNIVNSQF